MPFALLAVLAAIQEPQSQLELSLPAETPCVYLPESTLPSGCVARDLAAMKSSGGWLLANNASADGQLAIIGTRFEVKGVSASTPTDIDTFIRGVAALNFEPEPRGDHLHSIVEVMRLRVAEFGLRSATTMSEPGHAVHAIGYLVPVDDQLVTLLVLDQKGREAGIAEAILKSVRVPPKALASSRAFGGLGSKGLPSWGWISIPLLGVVAILITRILRRQPR